MKTGELAGDYRVVSEAGEGRFGPTFFAQHAHNGRSVLIHVLDGEVPARAIVEAFRSEASAAAQAGTSDMLAVLEVTALDDGRVIVAQEPPTGRRLLDLVARDPLPAGRAIGISRSVAKILAAAHDAGILHGALGPRSVWVDPTDDDAVEIGGFGFSTLGKGSRGDGREAPELASGLFDHRVDVFGIGGVLYAALTGEPTRDELDVTRHADLLPGLRDVLERSMRADPNARFDDVREFEASLLEAQLEAGLRSPADHRAVPTVQPERRERLAQALAESVPPLPVERKRPGRAIAVVGGVLVAGGLVMALSLGGGERAPAPPPVAAAPAAASDEAAKIDELTRAARAAATRSRYVFPPVDDRNAVTAHSALVEIEALGSDGARARGSELRQEFAQALRRVADGYYGIKPDSSVTTGLYMEVLAFTPDDAIALERVKSTPDEIEQFRLAVVDRQFSEAQLVNAEPLQIAKLDDPAARAELLAKHRSRTSESASPRSKDLEALVLLPFPWDEKHLIGGNVSSETAEDPLAVGEDGTQTPDLFATPPDETPEQKKTRAFEIAQLGTAAFKSGRREIAKRYLEKALELNPRLAYAHDALGSYYFERSNFTAAATHAGKAVGISPGTGAFRLRYGDALYRLQKYDDALAQYEAAQARGANAEGRIERTRKKL